MRNLIYLMIAFLILGCSTDVVNDSPQTLERNNGKGKGKGKGGNIQEIAFSATALNTNAIGNIAVFGGDYLGELPNNYGSPIDWDGDGVNDTVELYDDMILVNGVVVNNTQSYIWEINGFTDVDNDGDLDIIVKYGTNVCYNNGGSYPVWDASVTYNQGDKVRFYPGYGCCLIRYQALEDGLIGLSPNDTDTWRITHTVLYNEVGQFPLSIAEVLQSMVLVSDANNPQQISWDISEYGFECFPLHVWLMQNGQPISQTVTYDVWGLNYSSNEFVFDQIWFDKYDVTLDLP